MTVGIQNALWGTKQREVNAEIIKMRRKRAEAMLPKLAIALGSNI